LRSLNNFGFLPAIAHGKRIGLSEITKIALVATKRTEIHKPVQENPVPKMPGPQFPGGFENGVNLVLLRKAEQERNFAPIKNFFLMRLFQDIRQSMI
jgi:hypothetical protein